jgi:F0F1-type ATP synthase epsilon subunit
VTADEVIRSADLAVRQATARLNSDETLLHNRGYHTYGVAVFNMKNKIEKALNELVDELRDS